MASHLKDENEIKIFILYLLDKIGYPLDYPSIGSIMMQDGIVNFFDFAQCFFSLVDAGHIREIIVDGDKVPKDPHEALRLHQAIWNCGVRTALANGGVVNDHHGVGIKLGRLMKEQYGPAMQVFEGIKKQLDPNGIMNPFKLGL